MKKTFFISGLFLCVFFFTGCSTNPSDESISEPNQSGLLNEYQEFLEEIQDSNTKNNLLSSCENPQNFESQIQALETKLDFLKKQKNNNEKSIPTPGDQPLDMIEPTDFDKINTIEAEIIEGLNSLKSLCDEEEKTPEENPNSCVDACNKYVENCLTLVPNATKALFDDGYQSCLKECSKWDRNKIECMITALSCEAMTEKCGL